MSFEQSNGSRYSSVQLCKIGGRRITPVPVYVTAHREKAAAVLDALNSGLLGHITGAIIKNSK